MAIEKNFLLVLKSSALGDGEPDLGEKLMQSFLNMMWESETLPARIICMSTGVYLTTDGSYVADILMRFEKQGVDILSCGTCLDYYHRQDKLIIGKPTNMKDTVDAMLSFKKVITL